MQIVAILQVLLIILVGFWVAAKFRDSPFIKFFARNDWFMGAFFVITGYSNYVIYAGTFFRNLNLVLILIGVILIISSISDLLKKQ